MSNLSTNKVKQVFPYQKQLNVIMISFLLFFITVLLSLLLLLANSIDLFQAILAIETWTIFCKSYIFSKNSENFSYLCDKVIF